MAKAIKTEEPLPVTHLYCNMYKAQVFTSKGPVNPGAKIELTEDEARTMPMYFERVDVGLE